jgi:hypothetical protein
LKAVFRKNNRLCETKLIKVVFSGVTTDWC